MATSLFTRIDSELDASGVATSIEQAIAQLGDAQGLLGAVTSAPSAAIGQLSAALQALSIPELDPLKSLVANVQSLSDRIPDPDDVAGPAGKSLETLVASLDSDLLKPLGAALEAIQSAATLLPAAAPGAPLATEAAPGGADSSVASALGNLSQTLDAFPSPLTVESLLVFLRNLFREFPSELLPSPALPGITDFQQRLDTVLAWRDLDGPQLVDALRLTLEATARFIRTSILTDVSHAVDSIGAVTAALPLETLRTPMQALTQGLVELAGVVTTGDLSSVGNRVTDLTARVAQLNATLATLGSQVLDDQADGLTRELAQLPVVLDHRMRETLAVLQPPADPKQADPFGSALSSFFNQADADALLQNVRRLVLGVQNLLDSINLQAIRAPLLAAANAATTAVADLEDLLIAITSKISQVFDDVAGLVQQLDIASVTGAVEHALTNLRNSIRDLVTSLFAPVQAAIGSAVYGLAAATSAVGVDDIVNSVRDIIERFGDILGDPQVVNALGTAREAMDQAATALDSLSFTSVTDEVVADIDKVTAALKKIDPNALPDAVRGQLKSAVAVLPTEFDPIVQTITTKFDDVVDTGPKPFLTSIQDKPELLATRIQDFAPEKLVGDKLAGPYESLIEELAGFKPSQLLAPVRTALNDLTTRLHALDPGPLLAPLESLHADLLAKFAKLDPTQLIGPISGQVSDAIDAALSKVPADAIFDQIDRVLSFIQTVVGSVDAVRTLLQKLTGLLDGLVSPEHQVQQLLAPILSRIAQLPAPDALSAAFSSIRDAVSDVEGPAIVQQVATPLSACQTRLGQIDATRLHAALVRAYREFPRSVVEGLPTSEARTRVLAFFDGFDPRAATFARSFTGLADLQAQLAQRQSALTAFAPNWDALYHQPEGPLSEFARDRIGAAELSSILGDALTGSFAGPMKFLFGLLERIGALLHGVLATAGGFVDHVQAQLANLLALPEAVTVVRTAIQELVTTLQGLDLAVVAEGTQQVFASVRSQLEALDAAQIRVAVEAIFNDLVGSLDLDHLLPPNTLRNLDQTYEHVVDTIRGVDPTRLIVDVVQPEFDAAIKPLLDVIFSLSTLIKALVKRLDGLGDELGQSLSRTGDAFEKMVAAIPT